MRPLLLAFLFLAGFSNAYAQVKEVREITICWDVSASMAARNYGREQEFLHQYFSRYPESRVNLLLFSNAIWGREQFEIHSGDWSALDKRLQQAAYDGATSYRELPLYSSGQDVLIFTDGWRNMGDSTPVFNGNLYIVNSSDAFNPGNLNLLAILNDGELMNLAPKGSAPSGSDGTLYYGMIFGDQTEGSSISLQIKGRGSEAVRPDASGRFAIKAIPGEVLEFLVDGRQTAEKTLGDQENINIWLEGSGEIRLEEVVVTEQIKSGDEEDAQPGSSTGNSDGVGYAVQSVSEERIPDASTNVSNAVQGKFSGVHLGQNDDVSQFETRTKWSALSNNYGLIVIDGVPMAKSNSSVFASATPNQNTGFIDPRNIADITVLKGLVATNRFGSAGANGVMLITTKTASVAKGKQKKDLALLTDNLYDGRIKANDKQLTAGYIKTLQTARNIGDAYEVYLKQRASYPDNYNYFIDVFDYFREASPDLALRILSNILEMENPEYPGLKALLFKVRLVGDADLELQVANRIMQEFPGRTDAYLDLALANKTAGNHQASLDILLGMDSGSLNSELDFSILKKTVERELRNLVFLHQGKLDLTRLPPQYMNNVRFNARIVISWNQPEAAFGLQFVNPQKRFFTWEHSKAESSQRIGQEISHGFSIEEFEIVGQGVEGDWILNVNYQGNGRAANTNPVFLSCRVTFNFGKPGQRTEEFIIRLEEAGSEAQLAKIRLE